MCIEENKLVAIITLNYNHSKETLECVDSILKSTHTHFELIVIDNGSEITDYKKLCVGCKDERIHVVRQEPNIGYVGGVNLGLFKAQEYLPDYYLIMNNDTILDKSAIKELLLTSLRHKDQAIVSGKVYNIDATDTLQYIGQYCRNMNKLDYPPYVKNGREKDIGQYDNEIELEMSDDMLWLIPEEVFNAVGYYSTDFFLYGEQNDYALRAKKAGFKLIYTPKAKVWHYHHLTTSSGDPKMLGVLYWMSYASLLLAYKHLNFVYFICFYLERVSRSIVKYLFYKVRPKNKLDKEKNKVVLVANFQFSKWLLGSRGINTGYNPFL